MTGRILSEDTGGASGESRCLPTPPGNFRDESDFHSRQYWLNSAGRQGDGDCKQMKLWRGYLNCD